MATEARAQAATRPAVGTAAPVRPLGWYLGMVLRYTILLVTTVVLLGPFFLALLGSFKSNLEVVAYPPTLLPTSWHLENYVNVWNNVLDQRTHESLMPRWIFNSLFLGVIHVLTQL